MLQTILWLCGGLLTLSALATGVYKQGKNIKDWAMAPKRAKEAKVRYEKAYTEYEKATQEFMTTIDRFNHYMSGLTAVCSEILAENLSDTKADAIRARIQQNIDQTWEVDAFPEMKRHNEEDLMARRKLREVNYKIEEYIGKQHPHSP
jgi:flagellar motor switch protein FliG